MIKNASKLHIIFGLETKKMKKFFRLWKGYDLLQLAHKPVNVNNVPHVFAFADDAGVIFS